MEITSAEILKRLPDFSDLIKITDDIAKTLTEKLRLDKEIKEGEAHVIREAMRNEKYFVGGKPPSMSLLISTLVFTGLEDELLPLRDKYIVAIAEVERLKSRLDLYKEFLSMWRSLNASERAINAQ
jgi:hypothetical protein